MLNIEIYSFNVVFFIVQFHGEFEWQEAKSEEEMYVSHLNFVQKLTTNLLS